MGGFKNFRQNIRNQSLKGLNDRTREATARKYPHVPAHGLPKPKFNDTTANSLTRAIIQWLTLNGCYATRINTTGRWMPGQSVVDAIGRTREMKGQYIPGTTRIGTADIHAVIGGRHASIEVKVGRDRMSEAQHKTKATIEGAGGLYFIARDFQSFMEWHNTIVNKTA